MSDKKAKEKQGQTWVYNSQKLQKEVKLIGIDIKREVATNYVLCLFIWMSLDGVTA